MQWYYSKNGTQLGPIGQEELISKIATGEIAHTDLAWKEGMTDWLPVSQIADLRSAAPLPSAFPTNPTVQPNSPYTPPVATAAPYSPVINSGQQIPNYLWQSIVVTILCCWPLGIPAIIFAAKVDGLKAAGNIPAAMQASADAKKWLKIAFISGLIGGVIIFVLSAIGRR